MLQAERCTARERLHENCYMSTATASVPSGDAFAKSTAADLLQLAQLKSQLCCSGSPVFPSLQSPPCLLLRIHLKVTFPDRVARLPIMYNLRQAPVVPRLVVVYDLRIKEYSQLLSKTVLVGNAEVVTWNGVYLHYKDGPHEGYVKYTTDKTQQPSWTQLPQGMWMCSIGGTVLKADFEVVCPPRGTAANAYELRSRK